MSTRRQGVRNLPEYALITGTKEVPRQLEQTLRAALPVRRCSGPAETHCPVVHGEHCPLREQAKVAIVYLAGEYEFNSPGRWQCIVGGLSPAIAVIEGEERAPRARNGFAVVGAERGPTGVLEAITCLFDNPE